MSFDYLSAFTLFLKTFMLNKYIALAISALSLSLPLQNLSASDLLASSSLPASTSFEEEIFDYPADAPDDMERLTMMMDSLGFSAAVEEDTTVQDFSLLLDNLMNVWYVQDAAAEGDSLMTSMAVDYVPGKELHDSIYIERLSRIPSVVELTYNNVVRNYIHVYTIQKADKLATMLGLQDYYFPIIEEILDQYDLPLELKYMAVIESALNPDAVSRAGATGLWQFMLSTGRFYKLKITSFVDERRDPIAATHAAAHYLKDMYAVYQDWGLVIASYNCGAGNVNKAIRRAGGKRTYWEIYPYLPKETRGYVPAYIAATYAMTYYKEHGISPKHIDMPVASDTIMVHQNLNLNQVAEVLQIPIEQLRTLNSKYRRDIIPGKEMAYDLRLPMQYAGPFIDMEDSIYHYMADVYLKESLFKTTTPASAASGTVAVNAAGRKVYVVKRGDTLGAIAQTFKVSLTQLRNWNAISGSRINIGQKLIVSNVIASSSSVKDAGTAQVNSQGQTVYTVKKNDTLSSIATRYHVSVSNLRKWNQISGSRINIGQKIIVKQ